MRNSTALLGVTLLASPVAAEVAPPWEVAEWRGLPEGTTSLEVGDLRGNIVLLYLFAPGEAVANAAGFITFGRLATHFAGSKSVAFVAIQASRQPNAEDAAAFAHTLENLALAQPAGRAGTGGAALLDRYGVASAPWTVLIDSSGAIDQSARTFEANALLARVLELDPALAGAGPEAAPTPPVAVIETLPEERGGQDMVGTALPALAFDGWLPESEERALAPRATLYRWWTEGCPYCESSLPAMEELRVRYAASGLRVVGVYHPKPPRAVAEREVAEAATRLGFHGAIALDLDWSELQRAYDLRGRRRGATSVTFLVDSAGVVRFCHPGPELHPSADPAHAHCNADFLLLEQGVRALVGAR